MRKSRHFSAQASTQTLAHGVGFGRPYRCSQYSHTHSLHASVQVLGKDAIPVVDHESIGMLVRKRLAKLLQGPLRRWVGSQDDELLAAVLREVADFERLCLERGAFLGETADQLGDFRAKPRLPLFRLAARLRLKRHAQRCGVVEGVREMHRVEVVGVDLRFGAIECASLLLRGLGVRHRRQE